MAKTNKYTSINFNHILEKNSSATSATTNPTKQSSSSYSSIASANNTHKAFSPASRSHGRMLVLTKPSPKPIGTAPPLSSPSPSSSSQLTQRPNTQIPVRTPPDQPSDQISLRPLGRTGAGSESFASTPVQEREKEIGSVVVGSPKPDKFVPPHLRPGFAGREERPIPDVLRARESGQRHFGSLGRYGEDGRPKSGGHERTRIVGESDLGSMNRPRSSGHGPTSIE